MTNYRDMMARLFDEPTALETAEATIGEKPIEGFKSEGRERIARLETLNFLPLAATEYEISSDANDYVFVPVPIVPTDLPNRNSVAFPYETLLAFNPRIGRPNYKSWNGKPTFFEHANTDIKAAKGIIVDTYIKPITNTHGTLHKVMALCGYDRTKDRDLANAILRGERASYSMGAFITTYECSICGSHSKPNKLNTECGHVVRGRPQLHPLPNGKLRPSYLLARKGIEGFEVSSVAVPAWTSATNRQLFDMAMS